MTKTTMKATAIAPANIAFIKYWGKQDEKLRLPLNASFSMNLSEAVTTTTVEFSKNLATDEISAVNEVFSEKEKQRMSKHLDVIRKKARVNLQAKVVTKNSFPKGTGAAASASGFAALTVAAVSASGLSLSEKELTILARIGSGSACRSIPDGFVLWERGTDSENSFAHSLYPPDYWDLRDVLVIVASDMKKVLSTEGMSRVQTSPFLQSRLHGLPSKIKRMLTIFTKKDFAALGNLIEEDSLNMHAVMMTQSPPIFYWNSATLEIMHAVYEWRAQGFPVYFTIDAGPNVHLICEAKDEQKVVEKVRQLGVVNEIVVNKPSKGAGLLNQHLF